MRKFAWVAGSAVAAVAICAAWLIAGWGGPAAVQKVSIFAASGFAIFAAVCTGVAAASSSGRRRAAWIFMTIGVSSWAVGEILWGVQRLVLHTDPFPSVADIAYLVYPFAACAALVLYPGGCTGHSRIRIVLDGVIVSVAVFELSWVIVLRGVHQAGAESPTQAALSLAYPITDVLLITVALLALTRARKGHRAVLALLAVGNMLNALSDSSWVYLEAQNSYQEGHFLDVGWLTGLVLIGLAGLASLRTPQVEEQPLQAPSPVEMWMPYLPIAVAVAFCIPVLLPMRGSSALVVSSLVLVAAVLARQFLLMGDNQRLLSEVTDQALRDPLTGLANRVLFNDRLTHAVQLHQRDEQAVTVLSLDLDDFKLVNDSLGHPAGDALLVMVAKRLVSCVRTSDTVARLGGDEFAVLMEGSTRHARLLAQRIARAFEAPFHVEGHDLLIHPSFGLAVASDGDAHTSPDLLLKQADVAMYSAKRSRSGGVHTFSADMNSTEHREFEPRRDPAVGSNRGLAAVRLLGELRRAIDHVDLSVVYQPKFDLRDDGIVGAEALVRWQHRERGLLGPDVFLPLVREHGLMRSVTDLVLAQALDDVADWHARGVGIPIAVNMFAPAMGDMALPDQIGQALADRNLSASTLIVEITEDQLLSNLARSRAVIEQLRDNGIRVAIDDFGSGYSALWYLRELPVDELKLDRQFIAPILVNPRAAAIVRAVIDLSHELGVVTVAEGVEDAATAMRLLHYGCDVVQGFYYSPPVPAATLVDMLAVPTQAPAVAKSS